MTQRWTTPEKTRPGVLRFANIAVRAGRLIMAKRLDGLNALVVSQTRELRKTPEGREALEKTQQLITEAKRALRGKPNGR